MRENIQRKYKFLNGYRKQAECCKYQYTYYLEYEIITWTTCVNWNNRPDHEFLNKTTMRSMITISDLHNVIDHTHAMHGK